MNLSRLPLAVEALSLPGDSEAVRTEIFLTLRRANAWSHIGASSTWIGRRDNTIIFVAKQSEDGFDRGVSESLCDLELDLMHQDGCVTLYFWATAVGKSTDHEHFAEFYLNSLREVS